MFYIQNQNVHGKLKAILYNTRLSETRMIGVAIMFNIPQTAMVIKRCETCSRD